MRQKCVVHQLGVMEYEKAWHLQAALAREIAAGKRLPTLLLLEHPHTYTFGRRAHAENLLWSERKLKERGVKVYWVDRGGDITYHGPGQLVGYPLLPLDNKNLVHKNGSTRLPEVDYVGYIRKLEKTLIVALRHLGLTAHQVEGMTGIWVNTNRRSGQQPGTDVNLSITNEQLAKIAAIGIKVDAHGITQHGFALNVNPDMEYWDGIIGCGLAEYPVTCLAENLLHLPPMEEIIQAIIEAFGDTFGHQMVQEAFK